MNATIADGCTVRIEYTLRDDAGALIDSSEGREPLTYIHGRDEIIPGLEQGLAGLRAGDQRQVTVAPEDAYGLVDPTARLEVPRRAVPPEALVPGKQLMARTPSGDSQIVVVKEVGEENVVLDLNHPLAGRTLHFDVRVVDVSAP
jgi:FKBP-type peptidyl-prolyl cis-trans isomerase SlyD